MNHHLEVDQFKYMDRIGEQVTFSFGELDFCLHHFKVHEKALINTAQAISPIGDVDED